MLEADRNGDPAFIITRAEAETYGRMDWPAFFTTSHLILNVDGCVLFGSQRDNIWWVQTYPQMTWHRCEWFEAERAKGERPILDDPSPGL